MCFIEIEVYFIEEPSSKHPIRYFQIILVSFSNPEFSVFRIRLPSADQHVGTLHLRSDPPSAHRFPAFGKIYQGHSSQHLRRYSGQDDEDG